MSHFRLRQSPNESDVCTRRLSELEQDKALTAECERLKFLKRCNNVSIITPKFIYKQRLSILVMRWLALFSFLSIQKDITIISQMRTQITFVTARKLNLLVQSQFKENL